MKRCLKKQKKMPRKNTWQSDHEIGDEISVRFSKDELMKAILVYRKALDFINLVYKEVITKVPRRIDFEVSIDETSVPTSPEAHYYIAQELKKKKIHVDSMAPRFCGEFQKGIDYIGNLEEFEREFIIHSKIATHFGYRLSIHSGSDKLSVYPIISKYTDLNVHIKTAGTNWLEAVRLIATKNPSLYRKMHKFVCERLYEAKKYYHISAKPENIPNIDTMSDDELPKLMDKDDSRQVLHITYGLLLQEKDQCGDYAFRDEIYKTLREYENVYYEYLQKHIGKHLRELHVI